MTDGRIHAARHRAAHHHRRRGGFHLADLCVALAAAVLLFGVVVPGVAHRLGDSGSSRIKCASNLR